jgi:methyl-accepting chemotaxis protein
MESWSISKRIGLVAFTLIAALALVSVIAVAMTLTVSGKFRAADAAAARTVIAKNLQEQMFLARVAALKFRRAPSADLAVEFDRAAQSVDELLAEARAKVSGDTELRFYETFTDGLESYRTAFQALVVQQDLRDTRIARFEELSVEVRSTIREAMRLARESGQEDLGMVGATALERALIGQALLERYLLSNDEADLIAARDSVASARSEIEKMSMFTTTASLRDGTGAAVAALGAFQEAADLIAEATVARNAFGQDMDDVGPVAVDALDDVVNLLVAEQDTLAAQAHAISMTGLVTLIVMGVLTAGAAGLLAVVSTRRIARSIVGSVDAMSSLADGNLDVEVTGAEHDHELGKMARALAVLRDNARAACELEGRQREAERAARMREEEDARRDQQAEADRREQAAADRRRVILSLKDGLGSVVDAAAAGDFTRRIDSRFDEPELDEMAAGINLLVSNVQTGVAETARVMEQLANGDLTDRMRGSFSGTFADLQRNVNGTIENLAQLVSEIATQCEGLGQQVGSMTAQASDLARRAEQQAASLEETSAVMEEMSASANSSAEGATTASRTASRASSQVEEAGRIVASAVQAMDDIRNASQRIGDIVAVIDGIAFQTDLLALNASVEAARAGSAGKGFAVVATEVRALAQRSSEASQDIKALIEESTTQVSRGVDLVERTGTTLNEIVGGVRDMATVMQDLATTAREQATGVQEASSAITQMDVITQKNAALADESRETAAHVKSQAEAMQQMVSTFRTSARGPLGSRAIAAE